MQQHTLGEARHVVETENATIALVAHRAGIAYAPHAHTHAYLSYVLAGEFEERVGRSVTVAETANLVVMPAGVEHADRIGRRGHRALLITLKPSFEDELPRIGDMRVLCNAHISRLMIRLARAIKEWAPAQNAILDELLIAIVDGFRADEPRPDDRMRRCVRVALDALAADFATPTLRSLAAAAGVSPAYLARSFRDARGSTLGEYQRSLKARRAASLLSSQGMALADVALVAGFVDQSHLCRVFRREFGVSPGQYRRLAA